MAGKRWTEEELNILKESIGRHSLKFVAKKIGRSEHAVFLKSHRSGIGGFLQNTDRMSLFAVSKMLDIDRSILTRVWKKHGLKVSKVGNYNMVSQKNLINFMKDNQHLWTSLRGDMYLLANEDWYYEKHKRDLETNYKMQYFWTPKEDAMLIFMYNEGKSLREISEKIGRSYSAVHNRTHALRKKGRLYSS